MDIVTGILVVLHLLGWAIVFGGALANLKAPKISPGMLHGILTAIIAGILLVGIGEMGDGSVNHVKIGIKLVIALVAGGMIMWGGRNSEKVTKGFLGAVAGLVAVNVAIAVLW